MSVLARRKAISPGSLRIVDFAFGEVRIRDKVDHAKGEDLPCTRCTNGFQAPRNLRNEAEKEGQGSG